MFYKKAIPEGLLVHQKDTTTQVFSYEYYQIFKHTYFDKHLRTGVSDYTSSYPYHIFKHPLFHKITLREMCPNIGNSVRIQENVDQK